MQRWFGYRGSYISLCRVITTDQIFNKLVNINSNFKSNIINLNDVKRQNTVPIVKRTDRPTGKIGRNDLKVKKIGRDIFIKLDNKFGIELYNSLPKSDTLFDMSKFCSIVDNFSNSDELANFRLSFNQYTSLYDLKVNLRLVETDLINISSWSTHIKGGITTSDRFYKTSGTNNDNNCLITIYHHAENPLLLAFRAPKTSNSSLFVVNIDNLGNI